MRRGFAAAAVLATLALTPSAFAKEWVVAPPAVPVTKGAPPEIVAADFIDRSRALLDLGGITLSPRVALAVRAAGAPVRTVHFEQRHDGLRVVDRGVSVRMRGDEIQALSVDVARDLVASTTPEVDEASAEAIATAATGAVNFEKTELALLGRDGGVLIWILDARDDRGGTRTIVDAKSGAIVMSGSLAHDAKGRVYDISSVITPTPADEDLLTLDTSTDPIHLNGWEGLLSVTNYVSGDQQNGYTVAQDLVPSPVGGQDFLYDPPTDPLDPTDGFAQVNLFYHLTSMRNYYAGLGIDETAAKWKITAVANVLEGGQPLDNAFFSPMGQSGTFAAPNLIAIGQGSISDFAYDSDVFKHEFGHYVTFNTVNYDLGEFYTNQYGLQPFGGAIDEGSADYFACSANDDPVLGEASLGPLGAERDLTDDHKRCPEDMVGEAHADGEIVGSLGWTIRTALGRDKADRVMWGGLSMLTPGPTLGDLGKALVQSANDLKASGDLSQGDVDAVTTAVTARGLDDCDEVLALADGQSRTVSAVGLDLLGQFFGADCSSLQGFGIAMQSLFQFSRATAAADAAVHLHVEAEPNPSGDVSYTVFVRAKKPVAFDGGGMGLPAPNQYDAKFDFTSATADVVIDAQSMPAFQPGQTYYFAITHTSCPNVRFTVNADAMAPPSPVTASSSGVTSSSTGAGGEGGEGGSPSVNPKGGCDCTVGAGPDGSSPLALAAAVGLAAAVSARGKRRRERPRDRDRS